MRMQVALIRLARIALFLGMATAVAPRARAADALDATVPFSFTAGTASLPAGDYRAFVDWEERIVTVQDVKSGESHVAKFITTLARSPRLDPQDARLVFDKPVNGGFLLSEVWVPGLDGVLVGATPGKHTHETVSRKK